MISANELWNPFCYTVIAGFFMRSESLPSKQTPEITKIKATLKVAFLLNLELVVFMLQEDIMSVSNITFH
jgi:hypothetical protein